MIWSPEGLVATVDGTVMVTEREPDQEEITSVSVAHRALALTL